jgi:hypothetical protein
MKCGDMNMPGSGDACTWGPCFHPDDPRQPSDDYAEQVNAMVAQLMEDCCEATHAQSLCFDWELLQNDLSVIVNRIANAHATAGVFPDERRAGMGALGEELVRILKDALRPHAEREVQALQLDSGMAYEMRRAAA